MSYLFDTDTCSGHIKRPAGLAHRFIQHTGRLAIPSVVLAELRAGAHLRPDPSPLLRKIDDLLPEVRLLVFDRPCAEVFGELRGSLGRKGIAVASIDLMIASTALVHDLTLVTHNASHFARIPGLRLADWISP